MTTSQAPEKLEGVDEFRALEQLAKENSSAVRRELLSRLASQLVVGTEAYSPHAITLLSDIIVTMLDRVDEDDRAEFSRSVAPSPSTPHPVARKLAHDEAIRVAEPVLSKSPVLEDGDLLEVAETRSQEHLSAVAKRETLAAGVTDVIIGKGAPEAVKLVTENPGAAISRAGFERLAMKATENTDLMEALSQRADVPRSVAELVVASLPAVYQERLETLWERDPAKSSDLFAEAAVEYEESRLKSRRGLLEAKIAAQQIQSGQRSLSETIRHFAGIDCPREVTKILSIISKIPEPNVSASLFKVNGTAIALICRSVDLNDAAFEEVTNLRATRLKLPNSHGQHLLRIYRQLDAGIAKRTVRFAMMQSAARNAMVA